MQEPILSLNQIGLIILAAIVFGILVAWISAKL